MSILYNFTFDPDRKNLYTIYKDLSHLKKKRFAKKSYFTNLMYKKSAGNIDDYVDKKTYDRIKYNYYRLDKKHPVLEEKIIFQKHLQKHNIRGTVVLAELIYGKLLLDGEEYINEEEIISKLMKLAYLHNSIFIKPTDGQGGAGALKVNKGDRINIKSFFDSKKYIVEKTLVQHEELNKVFPHSMNALRVITFRINDKIVIPNCIFRMGTGNSYVDNASSGGIFAAYDIASNKLGSTSYQFFKNGAKSYKKHPVSNFVFKDAPLPFNKETIELVTTAAESFKKIESIGWDIGFTEDGPVIIEGNDKPHIVMMQITSLGLLNNDVYKEVFKEYL